MLKLVWIMIVLVMLTACDAVAEIDWVAPESQAQLETVFDALRRYEGLQQSVSEQGFPQIGDPDAPLEVYQISSFSCPFCADFYLNVFPELLARVESGEVLYIFVPFAGMGGVGDGYTASLAGVCAAQQDHFYTYAELLFAWQIRYQNDAFSLSRVEQLASFAGLDFDAWQTCITDPATDGILIDAQNFASQVPGFTGTPSIVVDGQIIRPNTPDAINDAIDAALVGNL